MGRSSVSQHALVSLDSRNASLWGTRPVPCNHLDHGSTSSHAFLPNPCLSCRLCVFHLRRLTLERIGRAQLAWEEKRRRRRGTCRSDHLRRDLRLLYPHRLAAFVRQAFSPTPSWPSYRIMRLVDHIGAPHTTALDLSYNGSSRWDLGWGKTNHRCRMWICSRMEQTTGKVLGRTHAEEIILSICTDGVRRRGGRDLGSQLRVV